MVTEQREQATVQLLREAISGQVILAGDAGYDEARRIHNGLIDKRPSLIVRCMHTADVMAAVAFAGEEGIEISVRGGGHNVAGKAVIEGGLMIDLSLMKGIHVDPVRQTVRAQPGLTVGELDRANAAFGLATPSGSISLTGIAGLTLGGGIAWLQGKYGLAVDNLLSAEVVLASGDVITASEDAERDLFWALRGGGGNFGIVSSFEFRAHPLASVIGGAVLHPLESAPQVFTFFREFSADLPDELTLQAGFIHAPDGSGAKLCAVIVCHAGDDAERAAADVQPIRHLGSPVADMVQRFPYPVMNTGADWCSRRAPSTTGSRRSSPSSRTARSRSWRKRSRGRPATGACSSSRSFTARSRASLPTRPPTHTGSRASTCC
jgi:FAD/FMN-containing dehydrogenase